MNSGSPLSTHRFSWFVPHLFAGLLLAQVGCSSNGYQGQLISHEGPGTLNDGGTDGGSGLDGGTTPVDAGPSCPALGTNLPLDAGCPAGQVEILGNAEEFCTNALVPGTQVTIRASDSDQSATTDSCGYWHLCVPTGSILNFTATAAGQITTTYSELKPMVSDQLPSNPGMVLLCSQVLSDINDVLNVDDYVTNDALVVASIAPINPDGGFWSPADSDPSFPCGDRAGWELSLADSSGNVIDAGIRYVAGLSFNNLATTTDTEGLAVFYNVPPALKQVQVLGKRSFVPAGEATCAFAGNRDPFDLTGLVDVEANSVSYAPFIIGAK